jgi:hypothetical protein
VLNPLRMPDHLTLIQAPVALIGQYDGAVNHYVSVVNIGGRVAKFRCSDTGIRTSGELAVCRQILIIDRS